MPSIRIPAGKIESAPYLVVFSPFCGIEIPPQPSGENIKVWIVGKHPGGRGFLQIYPTGSDDPLTFMLKSDWSLQKFSPDVFKGLTAVKFKLDVAIQEDLTFKLLMVPEKKEPEPSPAPHSSIHIVFPGFNGGV